MIRLVENRKDRDGNTLTMVDQFLFRQIEATLGIREAVYREKWNRCKS